MNTVLHKVLLPAMLVTAVVISPGLPAADNSDSEPEQTAGPDYLGTARAAIESEDYPRAIAQLNNALADDPRNADALNLMGYSHRKTGRLQEAFGFYRKALDIEPEHRGANEYLGELHLQRGELKKAEQRLAVLDSACFLPCEEYTDLKQAIAEYRKRKGLD